MHFLITETALIHVNIRIHRISSKGEVNLCVVSINMAGLKGGAEK